MITLIPEGGLCNRMRVVASASLLARRSGVPLTVQWYRTQDFNCRFADVFDNADLPFSVVEGNALGRIMKAGVRSLEIGRRLLGRSVYDPDATLATSFDAARVIEQGRHASVSVRTHAPLASEPGMYACFRPAGVPAERVAALVADGFGDVVGVHIRRTDNVKAIAGSPLSSFIALMDAEVAADPATRFFIASDSPETVAELRARFGPRILEYTKRAYRRDDPAAIEDAVVDLFGLSHCRKLIGSHWSSFTDTAHALRGIEFVIAGQP